MIWNFQYFKPGEFACKCCGAALIEADFVAKLEAMREEAGFPFSITSGYRCPAHNQRVSSTGPDGPHTTGRAVDIAVRGEHALWLVQNSYRHGFTGVGVQQKGGARFIHLDDLPHSARFWRPTIWSY